MLARAKEIRGYHLQATDGEIGKVKDFFFDDVSWIVRHVIADTGSWLASRRVLISPHAIQQVDHERRLLHVSLTRQQIEDSPPIEADQPVSTQREMEYYKYFGWPWYGTDIVGAPLYPVGLPSIPPVTDQLDAGERGDPHLRSIHEVNGYHIHAIDEALGHVDDFYLDEDSWTIRYLLLDTKNWGAGKRILLSPRWIERVSWQDREVFVNLSADAIRHAPAIDPSHPVSREFETQLHSHFGQKPYWT